MKITNAKIKNVTTRLDNKNRLIASVEFHEAITFSTFVFKLANPVELKNFTKLMEFAEAKETNEMEGKIIRVAEHEDAVRAIGHPIEDRFIEVTNKIFDAVEEISESKLLELYSNK